MTEKTFKETLRRLKVIESKITAVWQKQTLNESLDDIAWIADPLKDEFDNL